MFRKYKPIKESKLIQYQGIFRKELSLFQATALIVSTTIGAGILGVPFVIAKVGVGFGLAYIISVGILMIGLNLLVGEIAVKTKQRLQLVGFARKYLGRFGGGVMTILMYTLGIGAISAYVIGEGRTLSELFGNTPFFWSTIFAIIMLFLVYVGLRTLKSVELILSLGILVVVMLIAGVSLPHVQLDHIAYTDLAYVFLPYGVLLFAYHGVNSIPEAHSLLIRRDVTFKQSIVLAGVISILVYAIFATVVVGVTGSGTTEIATIGLGQKLGKTIFVLGNLFAILAMGTSALMVGLALKDSLSWDYKFPKLFATLIPCVVPYLVFAIGFRQFIVVLNIVGGVFMSLEMLLILLMYWRAKQMGHWKPGKYRLHHTVFIGIVLLFALSVGAVYSVWKLFSS
jgi:tyrosine-specific transport protein